jgi:hypothetical protein
MSYDISSHLGDEIKICPSGFFSIQLEESTDVADQA